MDIFDEVMNDDFSVFNNQDIFSTNYFPEVIQCRDNELRNILTNIKPLIINNKVMNTLIVGDSSTGKTTVLKHALYEIEQHTNIITCYINCNIQNTYRKCYLQIFKLVFGFEARNNIGTEIIQLEIMKKLEEESIILAIDDIDNLNRSDANRLINEIFRSNEFYHTNIALIVSMNNLIFKNFLKKNAKNILLGKIIEFKPYTEEEIFTILKYRCELGFREGTISDEDIKRISRNIFHYFNLREGLNILNTLGQNLNSKNKKQVSSEDLDDLLIT